MGMANTRPINKSNPKNIYCGHCEHFKETGCKDKYGYDLDICTNEKSEHFQSKRYYYHRCKAFEWRSYGERREGE